MHARHGQGPVRPRTPAPSRATVPHPASLSGRVPATGPRAQPAAWPDSHQRGRAQQGWLRLGLGLILALTLSYLLLWPTDVSPQAWQVDDNPGYQGPYAANTKLAGLQRVALGSSGGPEYLLAHGDWIYSGLANGDIVRLHLPSHRLERVANTSGRPLGLDFDAQGTLWIADAFKGLMRLDGLDTPHMRLQSALTSVPYPLDADPLQYADGVLVGGDGTVWVTDASRRFGAKAVGSTFEASVLDTLEHSCSGRLLAYDPRRAQARVALSGMCFPNGLANSHDGRHLFVVETGTYRVLDVDLAKLAMVRTAGGVNGVPSLNQAMQQGAVKVLLGNLPGYPDNLTRGEGGRIWVGLTKPRSAVVDLSAQHPILRSITMRLPRALWPVPPVYGHVLAFDESGRVLDDLQDPSGSYPDTTAATESHGRLYVQSLDADAIGWMVYPPRTSP